MKNFLKNTLVIVTIVALIVITVSSIISIPSTVSKVKLVYYMHKETELLNNIKILNKDLSELTEYSEELNNLIRMQNFIIKINNYKAFKELDDLSKYKIELLIISSLMHERMFNEASKKIDP